MAGKVIIPLPQNQPDFSRFRLNPYNGFLNYIDYNKITQYRKVIIGYSDIIVLLITKPD